MKTHEIRERFLQHFISRGHMLVPSAPLPLDDPEQLFVIAGMVPFVPYFLGQRTPESTRATSIQKCVRTLDIDEVGITTRHNTFFEMAGNFSFGDYFKQEVIPFAWALLTNPVEQGGFGIPTEKLWVTVYWDDDEAAQIWEHEVGVPPERIQRRGKKDNYWSMGMPGPAGPCSEIFYDRGPEYGQDGGPEADEDRYIEIWNLVFMEKLRGQGIGKEDFEILGDLPKKNIDTGMGIERVAFLLQGVDNVYESDLLRPVIDKVAEITAKTYGENPEVDRHFRVIADHTRTSVMLINDGILPGNEGRGYILRRMLRRIVRSAKLLGSHSDSTVGMREFISTSIAAMNAIYPELSTKAEHIISVAVDEEAAFLKTLAAGSKLFEQSVIDNKSRNTLHITGKQAFTLHDTYGFPLDLTLEMAREAGLQVDEAGFTALMTEQKNRAKQDAQSRKSGVADTTVYRSLLDQGTTDFTGYTELESIATIIGIISAGQSVGHAQVGETVEVFANRTPLYAESGGQMADHGILRGNNGSLGEITDVQKIAKTLWSHKVTMMAGSIALGDEITLSVDPQYRHGATQAHSATHIIHGALRSILGPQAVQAGSLNKPGYLRFDFRWNQKIDDLQRYDIEALSNQAVDDHHPVNTVETDLDSAKAMGAMALFGENYGDIVRVVEIGGPFSMELCGGTHVTNSAHIGPIAILGESSIGSGVRRIEALVGSTSYQHFAQERALLSGISAQLKVPAEQLPDRVEQLVERLKEAEKKISALQSKAAREQLDQAIVKARSENDLIYITQELPHGTRASDLRGLAQGVLARLSDTAAVIALAVVETEKIALLVATNSAAQARGFEAKTMLDQVLAFIDAKGGGNRDIAQGSGSNPVGLSAAFERISHITHASL